MVYTIDYAYIKTFKYTHTHRKIMICPNCKTENGYARIETRDWVCRKCGKISPIKIKEKIDHPKEEEIHIEEEQPKKTLKEQRKIYLEE